MMKNRWILVPCILPWDWSADYQRQTCLQLAKHNRVTAYLQTDACFFLKAWLSKKGPAYPRIKNIRFYRPLYLLPGRRIPAIEKLNQKISLKLLYWQYLAKKVAILWIFQPEAYFCTKAIPQLLSLYDCVDYFASVDKAFHRQIKEREAKLIKKVDLMTVNSLVLKRLHAKTRREIYLVPQGFRIQDFQRPLTTKTKFPKDKPLIGFVGAINYRMNFALLAAVIKANPQWRFILWGPIQTDRHQDILISTEKKIKQLCSLPNVIHGTSQDRREVAAIIRQFDIAFIPPDTQQLFNRYCYPMKLFEYFYMGKPVVSTPIEELKRFPKFVRIGNTPQSWEAHIKALLDKPWPAKYQQEQKKLAEANSWENKVGAITRLIEKRLPFS